MNEILLKVYIGLHVKYRLLMADFKEILIFSKDFRKIKKKNLIRISSVGGGGRVFRWGRTDRQT